MDDALQKIICRTCLKEASEYKSLLSKMEGDDRTIREVLSNMANVDISPDDKYPKQVCGECHMMIVKADEFCKRCLQSETILKNGFLSHTFEELIKHDMIGAEQFNVNMPSSQVQNHIMNNAYFDNCLKKDPSGFQEIEIPLVDNFYNPTDTLKNDLNYVKEEQDDFLQDDINDLAENIVVENNTLVQKLELFNTTANICGLAIDISSLKNTTKKCDKLSERADNNQIALVCPVCTQQFSNFELLQKHTHTHRGKKEFDIFQKYESTSTFPCEITIKKHIKEPNKKTKVKQKKQITKKNLLDSKKNGLILTLICPKCACTFPNLQIFQTHLKTHKDEMSRVKLEKEVHKFQCSMCMRKFVRKTSLIEHIKRHEDNAQIKFTCQTCKRQFQHKAHLENHVVLVHSKEKGFTCEVCSKSFSTQESLDSHKDRHNVDRKHDCKICGKSFTMLSTLTEHIKIHTGEKPYLCSVCGRGFSQKNNMMQHMRRHQGLKPFKCDTCERRFVSKGELEAHKRKHSGAHPFVCDDCGGSFTTSSSLTKHRRIHTGERPYACDLCPMRFTVLNTLKNHRRTHTGEKPYQCSHCEKAFTQRSDLVSHIRCHTGERPYICTSCGQAFRKASALKIHIKVHGKEPLIM